jgi:pimeloyl-ACP methyl ester carboxylesterase
MISRWKRSSLACAASLTSLVAVLAGCLAATQPGTGHALPAQPGAAAAVVSANPATVLSVLFPPDQALAEQAYVTGILSYSDRYQPSRTIIAAQSLAVQRWMAGEERGGTEFGQRVRIPTLVADGTQDPLNPVANDQALADSVPGARLILYPGASHGFLFQDETSFLSAVARFL